MGVGTDNELTVATNVAVMTVAIPNLSEPYTVTKYCVPLTNKPSSGSAVGTRPTGKHVTVVTWSLIAVVPMM